MKLKEREIYIVLSFVIFPIVWWKDFISFVYVGMVD